MSPPRSLPLVHRAVAEQARRTPDAPAVAAGAAVVTYRELDERSNRLAHHLRRLGVGPEVRVGVHLGRGADLIVVLLAVHKAGGAYVPVDPAYPLARRRHMIADSGAAVVVGHRPELTEIVGSDAARPLTVCLAGDAAQIAEQPADRPPPDHTTPRHLAYSIYTSGSTGKPKGVLIEHGSLANLVAHVVTAYDIRLGDRGGAVSAVSFDVLQWEVWPQLVSGGTVVPADDGVRLDAAKVVRWLRAERLTVAFLPPALYELAIVRPEIADVPLRVLMTGGDVARRRPGPRIPFAVENIYGPTETTVIATTAAVLDADREHGAIPIGTAVTGCHALVLDDRLRPAPDGEPGELCVGGLPVGRGYHGLPRLTADRFVPDPHGEPGSRLYRTGDRAVVGPDGRLLFLGRSDRQVQIRGVRVEPAEIEHTLLDHPDVAGAAVTAISYSGDPQLVAYVAPHADQQPPDDLAVTRIDTWRAVFDEAQDIPDEGDRASTAGWVSSHTGRALPAEDMRDWRRQVRERVLSLAPRRVLEIGCGTGLVLDEVLPHVEHYVATDLSPRTLARLGQRLVRTGQASKVTLLEREATDFTGLDARGFDTVVLNSVLQAFPSAEHLHRVLQQAVGATADGGAVYVGDVRSLPLHAAFHTSVQLHRADDDLPVRELRARIARALADERELLLHPGLLTQLPRRLPRVIAVEVHPKRGPHRNEMTMFRFDAVLRIGRTPATAPPTPSARWLDWARDVGDLAALRRLLAAGADPVIGVSGIPNALVAEPVRAHAELFGPSDAAIRSVGELRALLRSVPPGVAPEELHAAAGSTSYRVRLSCADGRPDGAVDAVFARHGDPRDVPVPHADPERVGDLASRPLQAARNAMLTRRLRRHLGERLPAQMVPAAVVVLDELPLTPSGKIDRERLPDVLAPIGERFTPPRTPTEEAITAAAAEVINASRIGVLDDLVAHGAHSLTFAQLANRIDDVFGVELSARTLFEAATVAGIARTVDELVTAMARDGRADDG